ncbi:MAG TPA: protein adenylyltransferase SelO family protein, partial [Longimicrobiales bacterium]|nr:protein adenylyltransferase SelO family protein [Longimicrobiales bacterium]
YAAALGDPALVRRLADHAIARHHPDAAGDYRAFYEAVVDAQARLIAQWMHVGFIHGVMNTDNMAVTGETVDYGPCAFMDEYNPAMVFSSIDRGGRYAYGNQPAIAEWNLTRLAECLLPLISQDDEQAVSEATESISAFGPQFKEAYDAGLLRKIGLTETSDVGLARQLLQIMADNGADFTLTFRRLVDAALTPDADEALRELFIDRTAVDGWLAKWRERLGAGRREAGALMKSVNPAVIPRNHRVEAAIRAAIDNDYGPFEELHAVLRNPFDDQTDFAAYMDPPLEQERVRQTFCGT